ncbi:MAG: hypothetical protein IJA80_00300 [Clostridia bacterium]|nr:hypothetical protein [Clostridia bacterium]
MKKMRKAMAVMLALVITLSCVSVLGYSAKQEYVPTIIIPGLFQCETYSYENGEIACDANGTPLAAPFYVSIGEKEITDIVTKALLPITKMFITQEDKDGLAAKEVSKILAGILMGKQRSDANGEFIDDVRPQVYEGSFATLTDSQREHVLRNFPVEEFFDIAGEENLYVFNYVSTGNMIQTSKDLYDYIQFVKKDTGAEKVNLIPVSQGGSITNGLMKYYDEQNISLSRDINRIVFAVPALDGAALLGDCYRYGFNKNSEALYTTAMPSVIGYENYLGYIINIAMRLMPKADIDVLLDEIASAMVNDYLRYSTLLWGLIPSGDYPACREKYLMGDDMKEIRRQADWYYDAQLKSEDYILEAIEDGVKVFDIVDTNVELYQLAVSHDKQNCDGIIHVDSTSMGAYSVNVGTKLPENYVASRNNCTDPKNHDHTDPEGIMDVCSGLLPEHTFYFSGQNHATTASNDVIMTLIIQLLTDEGFTSVHSYPDKFPQFNYGRETKTLREDVDYMRDYDTSTLTAEDAKELSEAIAQVDEMLKNKVVDTEEFKAANDRFYDIFNKITSGDSAKTMKGITRALYIITRTISDVLYFIYGDKAFSEMALKPILDALFR